MSDKKSENSEAMEKLRMRSQQGIFKNLCTQNITPIEPTQKQSDENEYQKIIDEIFGE